MQRRIVQPRTILGLSATVRGQILVRLDEPAPGIAHLFGMPMGGQVLLFLRVYLYGEQADPAAAREEEVWQAWFAERFPAEPPAGG